MARLQLGSLRLPWRRSWLRIALGLWLFSLLPVLVLRFVNPPFTLVMVQHWLAASEGERLHYQWADLETIAPSMYLAVVAAEDQKFPWHSGFDFQSIRLALEHSQEGGRLRGASTLSQQVAKNVFLWSGRSWLRKGLEAYYTLLIELVWGKPRILEMYLNVAELGPLTFGVEAASLRWLKMPAAHLKPHQAALLAAVLPNPRERSVAAPDRLVRERQAWILKQMRQLGPGHLAETLDLR